MIEAGIETDTRALGRSFGALADGVRKRVARKTTGFAMTPALKGARDRIQQRTGTSAEALKKKTKVYQGGEVSITMVGIAKRASVVIDGKTHRPANIEHLLHEGYIHAKTGQYVPGTRYAELSLQSARPEIERRVLVKLDREVTREVEKARAG